VDMRHHCVKRMRRHVLKTKGCVWPFSRILMVYVWTAARCLAVSRIDTKYQSTSQPCSL
jgi:hypothetical protein